MLIVIIFNLLHVYKKSESSKEQASHLYDYIWTISTIITFGYIAVTQN